MLFRSVTDDEILAAYASLARQEGVFGEPASAAAFAGLTKLSLNGYDLAGKRVVCIITGNGLKDPDTAMIAPQDVVERPAELEAVRALLEAR